MRIILITSPHEWDPSVLDYVQPDINGERSWTTDPNDRSQFDPNFDEFGDYVIRAIQILNIFDDTLIEFWTFYLYSLFFKMLNEIIQCLLCELFDH